MAGNYQPNYYSTLLLKAAIDSGIDSPKELASIMGNAHVETHGFSTMREEMNYRSIKTVLNAVASADKRFTKQQIQAAVDSRDPEKIATILYENRKDLSNSQPGDGWRFHGRGFFQYTGRFNYTKYGKQLGVDLVNHPDIAADPEIAAKLAIAFWKLKVPIEKRLDPVAAGAAINGGSNGQPERKHAAHAWEQLLTPQVIADIRTGRLSADQFPHPSPDRHVSDRVHSTLREGDRGPQVSELQQTLSQLNYRTPDGHPLATNGYFGPDTRTAVESFQREHGLHVDGVVGKDMRKVFAAIDANPFVSKYHPHHALYEQALQQVHAEETRRTIAHGPHSEMLAGALTVAAVRDGLTRIDRVVLNNPGTLALAFQVNPIRDDPALNRRTDAVNTQQATQQSLHLSHEQVQQLSAQQQQRLDPYLQASHNPVNEQPAARAHAR